MKFTKRIFNKKLNFLISIFLLFTLLSLSGIVSAHNPTDMDLSFDTSTKELKVSITHPVSDTNIHYIKKIYIKINQEEPIIEEYTRQPGNSFTYTFDGLEVIEGYAVRVNAECNQGGSIIRELKVGSGVTIINEDGGDSSPSFEFLIMIISIISMVIILKRNKG
jgi:hypothetical protein